MQQYKVCTSPIGYYKNIINIDTDLIYHKEAQVRTQLERLLPKWKNSLARVEYDAINQQLHWFADSDAYQAYQELSEFDKRGAYQAYQNFCNDLEQAIEERMSQDRKNKQILQQLLKLLSEDSIYYKVDESGGGSLLLVGWGMELNPGTYDPSGVIRVAVDTFYSVRFDLGEGATVLDADRSLLSYKRRRGHELQLRDIPELIPKDGYTFQGWQPHYPAGHKVSEDITFTAQYSYVAPEPTAPIVEEESMPMEEPLCRVDFVAGEGLSLLGSTYRLVPRRTILASEEIPFAQAEEGYRFKSWSEGIDRPITTDCTFYADADTEQVNAHFDVGNEGILQGTESLTKPYGVRLLEADIPNVEAKKGYRFTGWQPKPEETELTSNTTFTAQYEPYIPWYKRFWLWLTGGPMGGCLRWLLYILAFLPLIALFVGLFRACGRDYGYGAGYNYADDSTGVVLDTIGRATLPDGRSIDDNTRVDGSGVVGGEAPSIVGDDGVLPGEPVTAPVVGGDGSTAPIGTEPDGRRIIINRLNVFFEGENADVDQFSKDFKQSYPDESYRIIGVDKNIPMVQVQIPEVERNNMREDLPRRLKRQPIFVVDETLISGGSIPGGSKSTASPGWHLKSIEAPKAWQISKGSSQVKVAVIDDGIDPKHPMFAGKAIQGYNVFRGDNRLSIGQGHGTHVAGIAVGNHSAISKGAAGIAPDCSLMVVQVADNQMITTSSLIAGIMYALNHGADVLNVSIGMSLSFAKGMSEAEQSQLAKTQFKPEERVYRKVLAIAKKRQAIIVFAAGNDAVMTLIDPTHRSGISINVAAYEDDEKLADFTNSGQETHISAPGVGIVSAVPGGAYVAQDGTSMAAPIITGAVALMKSIKPNISVEEVSNILRDTAYDYTYVGGRSKQSHTLNLRLAKALEVLKNQNNNQQ